MADVDYWRPYVRAIALRHALGDDLQIEGGLPGTNAVFLLDRHTVVKLYPPLFDGGESSARERAAYRLLSQDARLPVPPLIAEGQLFDDAGWPWPYIVTGAIAGRSYGEVVAQLGPAERERAADWLGTTCRQLHALPLRPAGALEPGWDAFAAFLRSRRAACVADQRRWGTLPPALIAQIERYLLPLDALLDRSGPPALLHADLNADHLLGDWRDDAWQPAGLIDFGDARIGDPCYELAALHLGLFGGDKRLLRRFLRSYGRDRLSPSLPRRAMGYTLLHEFDLLDAVLPRLLAAQPIGDLDQLARRLWALDETA